MTAADTPVWSAIDGDAELARLNLAWNRARAEARRALARYGTWEELTTQPRPSAALDVLIPPHVRTDARLRKVTFAELNGHT